LGDFFRFLKEITQATDRLDAHQSSDRKSAPERLHRSA
jgi:hypothetical protein